MEGDEKSVSSHGKKETSYFPVMKRAQLSVFLVLGLVLLIIAAMTFLANKSKEEGPLTQDAGLSSFENNVEAFNEYTSSCLKIQAEKALAYYRSKAKSALAQGKKPAISEAGFVRYYLKVQGSACFEAALFAGIDVSVAAPYKVRVDDAQDELAVRIGLGTHLEQAQFKKTINSYTFSIPKDAKLEHVGDLPVGDMLFEIHFPLKPIDPKLFADGEAIISYAANPRTSTSFLEELDLLPITTREPFYDAVLAAYPSIENKSGPWTPLLFDELIAFDEKEMSFEELRQKLKQYPVVKEVFRKANFYSSEQLNLEFLQQQAFGEQSTTFNDNLYRYQWYLENKGQFSGLIGADIHIKGIEIQKNSSPTIAVIDQGVFKNPDLLLDYEKSYDVVYKSADVTPPSKKQFHGTHVSGVICAKSNNTIGIAGVCPHCDVLNLKIFDQEGSDSRLLLNGILLAAFLQADIISMSLGGSYYVEYEQFIINQLTKEGIIFIGAAGNDGIDKKSYPGAYENVITVGATDNTDSMAAFSNWGDWVDLYAPGEHILSSCTQDTFCFSSGTSMATPLVSGITGLILSKDPTLNSEQVLSILKQSADVTEEGLLRVNTKRALETMNQE